MLATAISGCAKDDELRTEGLSLGAGNAMRVNSALQIIDPWPAGVEDTDISVPNDNGGGGSTPDGGAGGNPVAPPPTSSGTN